MPAIEGPAFAKINLGLRVLGKRSDGFHELRTVFQTISLADRVRVGYRRSTRRQTTLRCDVAELENDRNLAARAAERLLGAAAAGGRVEIALCKKIPRGAGLGGGSSDAAAVLLALAALMRPAPPAAELFAAAEDLGSDVPFFLVGGRAVGLGRGEEVYPLPEGPRRRLVVVAPADAVDTTEAYRALAARRGAELTPDRHRLIIKTFHSGISAPRLGDPGLAEAPINDFEDVIFSELPQLAAWKARLLRSGADPALMSGSGSALYGVFRDGQAARKAFDRLRRFGERVFLASTVSRKVCRAQWAASRAVND